MGQKIKGPAELLEKTFSATEWEFLRQHKDFKVELKKGCKTLDDYERLSILGAQLILEIEAASNKSPAPPVRSRQDKRR
jgi:hypothetical protein